MRQKVVSLFLCYLLLYTCGGVEAGKEGLQEKVESFGNLGLEIQACL